MLLKKLSPVQGPAVLPPSTEEQLTANRPSQISCMAQLKMMNMHHNIQSYEIYQTKSQIHSASSVELEYLDISTLPPGNHIAPEFQAQVFYMKVSLRRLNTIKHKIQEFFLSTTLPPTAWTFSCQDMHLWSAGWTRPEVGKADIQKHDVYNCRILTWTL